MPPDGKTEQQQQAQSPTTISLGRGISAEGGSSGGSYQTETTPQKKVEITSGKTKLAGVLGPEMVQKTTALESMAEGRAPEIAREEVLSSEAEAIAKSAIYRAISILKSEEQIQDTHPFIYVKKALEALYSTKDDQGQIVSITDKDGNPVFDLSAINPNTEEGARKIAKAVEELFSQNPEQAAVLGFKVLTDLRAMIAKVFKFEEIKEPEDKGKKKEGKKLPSFTELLTACGLEDLMEFDIGPDGSTIVSLRIPEDLTFETYKKIYQQKLEKALEKTPWKIFFGKTRAKAALERGNLIELTEEQFNELKRQVKEAGGKKQIGRIEIKQGVQDDQILSKFLSKFLGLSQISEFGVSTTDPEKRRKASERVNGVLSDFIKVYNELRVYTGAPPVKGSEFLTIESLAIPGTSITVDAIIEKIQGETKKRLKKEAQKKESEAWRKRIAVRKKEAEAAAGKDEEESEEGKKKRERRDALIKAIEGFLDIQEELSIAEDEVKKFLKKRQISPEILSLFGDKEEEQIQNLLIFIRGDYSLDRNKIDDFVSKMSKKRKELSSEQSKDPIILELRTKISELKNQLLNSRTITIPLLDDKGNPKLDQKGKPLMQTIEGLSSDIQAQIYSQIRELERRIEERLDKLAPVLPPSEIEGYILSLIGLPTDIRQNPERIQSLTIPQLKSYLELRNQANNFEDQARRLGRLSSLGGEIIVEKVGDNQITLKSKLDEGQGVDWRIVLEKLKEKGELSQTELLQLTALEEMFKVENGAEETDVLGAVYGRLEEVNKSGFRLPKYEKDMWQRAGIEEAGDLNDDGARIIYILFGKKYLEPLANGISTDTIKAIYALIGNILTTTNTNTNTNAGSLGNFDANSLGNLLDEWETSLLKIAKPGTNQQQAQPPQSQPSSGGAQEQGQVQARNVNDEAFYE